MPKDNTSVLYRIRQGNIVSEKSAGTMVFDAAAGQMIEQDRRVTLRGSLTLEVMEHRSVMEFRSDSETKIRVRAGS
jgi:hypothetical protein